MNGLSDIRLTIKAATRCGSRLTCDKLDTKMTCEECLKTEAQRKLGEDGSLPHFTVKGIRLQTKEIHPDPQTHAEVTVHFTVPRPGEVYGPYYKVGAKGHLINREMAERFIGKKILAEKTEQALQTAMRRTQP